MSTWRDDPWEDKNLPPCSKCGQPWQAHYNSTKYKMGPFGTFDLKAGMHTPHIPGVHAPKKCDSDAGTHYHGAGYNCECGDRPNVMTTPKGS